MQRLFVLLAVVTLVTAGATPVFSQAGARGRAAAPTTHTLTVTGNVGNATVLINGEQRGTSLPATLTLSPGTYTVQVRATGYIDFSQTVNLNSNQTVNANLQPATARVSLFVPQNILNQSISNPASQVQVFVDGNQVTGSSFDVPAGRRTIRIRSGGLSAELTRDFTAGAQYTISPFFSVQVQ